MKDRLDTLIKAINLAHYDAVKTLEVDIEDLMLLRSIIIDQHKAIEKATKDIYILDAKLNLKMIEKPIRLSVYV